MLTKDEGYQHGQNSKIAAARRKACHELYKTVRLLRCENLGGRHRVVNMLDAKFARGREFREIACSLVASRTQIDDRFDIVAGGIPRKLPGSWLSRGIQLPFNHCVEIAESFRNALHEPALPRADGRYRDLYDAVLKLERADRSNPLTVAKGHRRYDLPVQVFVRLMMDTRQSQASFVEI